MSTTPVPQPSAPDISQGLQPSTTAAAPSTPSPAAQPADPNATAPAPYSVDAGPQFVRDSTNGIKVTPGNAADFQDQAMGGAENNQAYVNPEDPTNIRVMRPDLVTQNVIDHEMSHVYMDQLEKQGVKFAPVNAKDPYSYDPSKMTGKQDTDFSQEQLARMVQDDSGKIKNLQAMAKGGSLTQKDIDDYQKWKGAVGPVISQLASRIKGAKTYSAQDAPNSVSDIPAMSSTRIDLSAGLTPKSSAGPKPAGF